MYIKTHSATNDITKVIKKPLAENGNRPALVAVEIFLNIQLCLLTEGKIRNQICCMLCVILFNRFVTGQGLINMLYW